MEWLARRSRKKRSKMEKCTIQKNVNYTIQNVKCIILSSEMHNTIWNNAQCADGDQVECNATQIVRMQCKKV